MNSKQQTQNMSLKQPKNTDCDTNMEDTKLPAGEVFLSFLLFY